MNYPNRLLKWLLALGCVMAGVAAVAAEPSMAQIYQAAEAGKVAQAQSMIQQVLLNHPDSAKAHYVDAELLARQGQLAAARSELQTAERLAPGLPFAKASAVAALQSQTSASARIPGLAALAPSATAARRPGNWIPIVALMGVLVGAYVFFRARNRPGTTAWNGATAGPYAPAGTAMPASYGGQPYGMAPPAGPGGGIGSGMLGGLAAGAAAGAGMVAGQALMHRMLDGNAASAPVRVAEPQWDKTPPANDMGGENFGITDTGSWDDAGSGDAGSSDW